MTNDAASACDRTAFLGPYRGAKFTNNATRTFVIPEADLSQEFGLTETVGSLPVPQAKALVEKVRERLTSCSLRDLNTDVERVERRDVGATSLTAWRLDIAVTDKRTVTFWMAIVRDGTSLAQVGFLPDDEAEMMAGAFVALAQRSLERLGETAAAAQGRLRLRSPEATRPVRSGRITPRMSQERRCGMIPSELTRLLPAPGPAPRSREVARWSRPSPTGGGLTTVLPSLPPPPPPLSGAARASPRHQIPPHTRPAPRRIP